MGPFYWLLFLACEWYRWSRFTPASCYLGSNFEGRDGMKKLRTRIGFLAALLLTIILSNGEAPGKDYLAYI